MQLGRRSFVVVHSPTEWYFRVHGYGLGFRDHRVYPPLFTERNSGRYGIKRRRYLHFGPYCIAVFVPR